MVYPPGMMPVRFSFTESNPDMTASRTAARQLAGRLLRAAAYAMQSGHADTLTLRIPGNAKDAALAGASLLVVAQQVDPVPSHISPKWERTNPDQTNKETVPATAMTGTTTKGAHHEAR